MRKALKQKVAYKPIPFKEGNGFLPNMSFRENGFCSQSILRQLSYGCTFSQLYWIDRSTYEIGINLA